MAVSLEAASAASAARSAIKNSNVLEIEQETVLLDSTVGPTVRSSVALAMI